MAYICHKYHLPSVWTQEEDKLLKRVLGVFLVGLFLFGGQNNLFLIFKGSWEALAVELLSVKAFQPTSKQMCSQVIIS